MGMYLDCRALMQVDTAAMLWGRSYQSRRVQKCNKKIASGAFYAVAKLITTAKTKEDVLKCLMYFRVLH